MNTPEQMNITESACYLMAASSRTFLLGLNRLSMVFDKRTTPMIRETMHTFCFASDEVAHLLNGTVPDPVPGHWEYRRANLVEKVQDRAQYGGEGIIVEFKAKKLEVPGFEYEYWDATPLMFGFAPGIANVSNVYRLTNDDPLTITPVDIDSIIP